MKPHLQFRISIAMMVVGNIAMAMATKFRGLVLGGFYWPIALSLVIGGLVSFIVSLVRMYQAK